MQEVRRSFDLNQFCVCVFINRILFPSSSLHPHPTDIDETASKRASSKSGVERMLEFGKELFLLSQRLEQDSGINESNQKMLEVRVDVQYSVAV